MVHITKTTLLLVLAAFILVLPSGVIRASREEAGRAATSITDIEVSFKMDPRITRGMYMGDLWLSSATYFGAAGETITLEARAHGLDTKGKQIVISPTWTPADPDMVEVSPDQGNAVRITVKRAGQSSLQVALQGAFRELSIKAAHQDNVMRVEISGPLAGNQPEATKDTENKKKKVSYSLGYETGRNMKNSSVDFDVDIFIKAFSEGFAGNKAAMTDEEMRDVVQAVQKEMAARQPEKKKETAERHKQLAGKNRKEGEAFLAENAKKEGVVTLPSGLQYKVIKDGTGKQPTKTDKVKAHYRGSLINGAEFDSSYKRGEPATLAVDRVIKGWAEALQLMPVGSRWQLFIPSNLAYGERGAGARSKIGPNATLIFEVELISIADTSR
jgi:FKBP-type peptidyl-prolyl cis-trans isomerase FklB